MTDGVVPVLVVGGGPVGLATALLLARWSVPSVVLEARPVPDPVGSKAICMQRDVLDILDRLGCAEAMVAEGVTWSVGRTYYRDHELFTTTFPDPGRSAFPPWINVSQASTERYLRARAEAQPLVDLRFGHEVTALRQGADFVEVDVRGPDGQARALRARHLVGADGSRSTVRRLLGVGFPGRSFDDQFLIVDIRADLPFPNERRFYFDPPWNPGRQVLVHAQPGRVYRIDWQIPPDVDIEAEQRSGALDARIRKITGDVPYEVEWLSVYRFHQRCAERFGVGRAFLAGDAAHLVAPFGARGLNSGLQDADNLAWKLAFAEHGWAGPGLLGSYEQERRAAALENLAVTGATMEFLVPQTEHDRRRREETLERSVADPSACSGINSGKLAEPFWYLESPLTSGPPPAGFPAQPGVARPPVAGVLCPDGPCRVEGRPEVRRLRQLFGAGFAVLTASSGRLGPALEVAAGVAAGGGGPAAVYALDAIDSEGVLAAALRAGTDSVHVVRPDGHLAAVFPAFDAPALAGALRRAAGAGCTPRPARCG